MPVDSTPALAEEAPGNPRVIKAGSKSLTTSYVLCALFAGVGAHRFYLQDWSSVSCHPRSGDVSWLVGVWLSLNFILFAFGGNYVLRSPGLTPCDGWSGPDSGIIAGGCWNRQSSTYQFFWVLHYVNMLFFFASYIAELCRLPGIVARRNK